VPRGARRSGTMPAMAAEAPVPIAEELLSRLAGSPDIYPQRLDLAAQRVLLVQLDLAAYRAASFLDDRILGPATKGAWVTAAQANEASNRIARSRPLHFIFHTGHVGSTLVSRLLDENGSSLSLREPLPLRTLAEAHDVLEQPDSLLSRSQFDQYLALFLRLWGRGYPMTDAVVVKATSSAGRLATPLLTRSEGSRAIYMSLRPEPYLATLLAGQNSPADLRGHAPERIRRLRSRVSAPTAPLYTMSLGELAAMSWLAETSTRREALARFRARLIAVDFDDFLADVAAGVRLILDHFGLACDTRYLADIGHSPVLTRYSKAPEYAYTPDFRAQVLRDSRLHNSAEIRRGMDWLERQGRESAEIAAIVSAT